MRRADPSPFHQQGIWAIYRIAPLTDANGTTTEPGFLETCRLASRYSSGDVHNLAIEITQDGRFVWRIGHRQVWQVRNVGVPSGDARAVTVAQFGDLASNYTFTPLELSGGQMIVASGQALAASDPNNAEQKQALVRYPGIDFASAMSFWDEEFQHENRFFGQGTEANLYSVEMVKYREESGNSSSKSHGDGRQRQYSSFQSHSYYS